MNADITMVVASKLASICLVGLCVVVNMGMSLILTTKIALVSIQHSALYYALFSVYYYFKH